MANTFWELIKLAEQAKYASKGKILKRVGELVKGTKVNKTVKEMKRTGRTATRAEKVEAVKVLGTRAGAAVGVLGAVKLSLGKRKKK